MTLACLESLLKLEGPAINLLICDNASDDDSAPRIEAELDRLAAAGQRMGVAAFFADPHSPWQRGSNENTNSLLHKHLPKGPYLSGYTQNDLNAIAQKLNNRPRKVHGFRTSLQAYNETFKLVQIPTQRCH